MISNIIVNELDFTFTELTKGTNLFAERPATSQCVYVKHVSTREFENIDSTFRKSVMRLFIDGYSIQEGFDLAEDIIPVLESMRGDYTYSAEEYDLKQIKIDDFPHLIQDDGHNSVIFTFTMIYHRR